MHPIEVCAVVFLTIIWNCRQAGVPESGLQTALAALVAAGYKVGVIEQIETGEEAKKRDPKAIVRRKLTSVETPATPLDPAGTDSVHLLSVVPVQATGAPMCKLLFDAHFT